MSLFLRQSDNKRSILSGDGSRIVPFEIVGLLVMTVNVATCSKGAVDSPNSVDLKLPSTDRRRDKTTVRQR